jgi:hypothetical protein
MQTQGPARRAGGECAGIAQADDQAAGVSYSRGRASTRLEPLERRVVERYEALTALPELSTAIDQRPRVRMSREGLDFEPCGPAAPIAGGTRMAKRRGKDARERVPVVRRQRRGALFRIPLCSGGITCLTERSHVVS